MLQVHYKVWYINKWRHYSTKFRNSISALRTINILKSAGYSVYIEGYNIVPKNGKWFDLLQEGGE